MTVADPTVADLVEENRVLREFFDAWTFFHQMRGAPTTGSETWDKIRLEKAAQGLADAAKAVSGHKPAAPRAH